MEDRKLLTTCTVLNNNDSGADSLRSCISPSFDTITFDNEPLDIQLLSALPVINWGPLSIVGEVDQEGLPAITVRGEGENDPYRIFEISSGFTVTMENLTISDGVSADGGGIKNSGDLTLSNVIVENNVAEQLDGEDEILGGGISNYGDLLVTDGSRIRLNNIAGGGLEDLSLCPFFFAGAGIHNASDAHVVIEDDSFVTQNVVCDPNHGTLDPCEANEFPSDSATFLGGGIFHKGNEGGSVKVIQSTINDNAVFAMDPGDGLGFRGQGGGIHSECDHSPAEGCIVIDSSTFSGNLVHAEGTVENEEGVESVAQGAALAVTGARVLQEGFDDPIEAAYKVKIVNSTFANNAVESFVTGQECPHNLTPDTDPCRISGGAIWFKGIDMDIRSSSFVGNQARSTINNTEAAGISGSDVPLSFLFLGGSLFVNNVLEDDQDLEDNIVLSLDFDMTSLGRNLFDDDPNEGEIGNDQVNTEVCFLPLGPQDGPTHTVELA